MTSFITGEIRAKALAHAIDYHRTLPSIYQVGHKAPSAADIIATAEKFAGFLLVEKKTQQPRAKK